MGKKLLFFILILVVVIILSVLLFILFAERDHINIHNRIVISLTTTPERLPKIRKTLDSLRNQTRPANAIYLNLPYFSKRTGKEYILPEWLNEYPEITVVRCEDWGPATKLVPVLEQEKDPNTLIIVVDDDIWYPPFLVMKYLKYSSKFPEAALTLGGSLMGNGKNSKFEHNLPESFLSGFTTSVFMINGHASYVLRRRFFEDDFLSYLQNSFETGGSDCYLSDDLTISYYLDTKAIKKKCLKYSDFSRVNIKVLDLGLKSDALHVVSPNNGKYTRCYNYLTASPPSKKDLTVKSSSKIPLVNGNSPS